MAAKRNSISKKTRFEVFKRDGFVCQYCGAHPPGVLLHVDHILAVANGGKNEFDNYVTACEPCNLGKGARDLLVVPQSLSDRALDIAEREKQLLGYQKIIEGRRERLNSETWRVLEVIYGKLDTVHQAEYNSVRMFIEKLGLHEIIDSAEIAIASRIQRRNLFRYFCGVCWSKVREAQS